MVNNSDCEKCVNILYLWCLMTLDGLGMPNLKSPAQKNNIHNCP